MLDDATAPSIAPGSYVGFVETLTPERIEGWAINRKDLSDHPQVKAMLDGKVIGTAKCELFREHVAKSGAGDGHYGFSIKLKGKLSAARTADVVVVVDRSDGQPPVRLLMTRDARVGSGVPSARPIGESETKTSLLFAFDVSDLFQYFKDSRIPTGIQRVQIEIIDNLVRRDAEYPVTIICFSSSVDFWVEIPLALFSRICSLSREGSRLSAEIWNAALFEIEDHLKKALRFKFPPRSYLINLGTSWWLQNYFLKVRTAKELYQIKYIPFVHDCIPVVTPEHCAAGLTKNFVSWITNVFHHADHIMVNSNATATDVAAVARYLNQAVLPPAIIKLDADCRTGSKENRSELPSAYSEVFLKNNIRPAHFVLLVSTIESRKNHLMALSAWLSLIKKYGLAKTPFLVCVGKPGWLNDPIYAKLNSSDLLQQRVLLLSGISDEDLAQLYAGCLITLYPSFYEGWGLPVTEALCYGKVPLVANNSSLPEAGGEYADYFDLGSENEMLAKLERLLFDVEYRESREAKIRSGFAPRSWKQIATEVAENVKNWYRMDSVKLAPNSWLTEAKPGAYYSFGEMQEALLSAETTSGEIFRQGEGWWGPEPWGCWTKDVPGRFSFLFKNPSGRAMTLFVGIRGVQGHQSTATVMIEKLCARTVSLGPEQDQWLIFRLDSKSIDRLEKVDGAVLVEVLCSSDRAAEFSKFTNGIDLRVAGSGVRGFMICREDDIVARLNFLESVALHDTFSMTGGLLSERLDPPAVWSQTDACAIRDNSPINRSPSTEDGDGSTPSLNLPPQHAALTRDRTRVPKHEQAVAHLHYRDEKRRKPRKVLK